jgi:hypothetical protein
MVAGNRWHAWRMPAQRKKAGGEGDGQKKGKKKPANQSVRGLIQFKKSWRRQCQYTAVQQIVPGFICIFLYFIKSWKSTAHLLRIGKK